MGHVEFCRVLEKLPRNAGGGDDDSSMEDDGGEEDDGIVFRWTDRRVAVKVNYVDRMDQLRGRHAEDPLQEIAAMQLLGDAPTNILGAEEVLFDGQNLNVVMRFCRNGDLFQLLQDAQNRPNPIPGVPGMTEGEARHWFRQIMNGVRFLHTHGICHRDLSPENVMIDEHESLIIDMGMCLRVPYPSNEGHVAVQDAPEGVVRCLVKSQGPSGKLPYMSPEVYTSRGPFDGHAIDVWTSGTILFCMLTGTSWPCIPGLLPILTAFCCCFGPGNRSYQRPHLTDPQFYWMTKGLRQLLTDWNANLSEDCIQLLEGMLTVSPRRRLTVDEVLTHPWFDGPDEGPMPIEG
jgi:serine/threonine protein kinase